MNFERRFLAMSPLGQWATHRLLTVVLPAFGLAGLVALSGCGRAARAPEIPSVFEVTGQTTLNGYTLTTVRDTGTGCEFVMSNGGGLLPRNERSIDGSAVKQRCVLTGVEGSGPGVTTTVLPADPAQTSVLDSQAADVAAAVRDATAPPPTGREIPPPSGKGTRPRSVPAPTPTRSPEPQAPADGVESQMKR